MGTIDRIGTATTASITPQNSKELATPFGDEDSFTFITLEESKSFGSCDDLRGLSSNAVNGSRVLNDVKQSPYRQRISIDDALSEATNTTPKASALQTPYIISSAPQTPYTYETIDSATTRTGIRTQCTYSTMETLGNENATDRTHTTTSKRSVASKMDSAQSPLGGRKICDASSPLPNSIQCTTQQKTDNLCHMDLDRFSIDQYVSSPDRSSNCFSIDSYASWDDDIGFGGVGSTVLDLARARRDLSLDRLRSMENGNFHSLRMGRPSTPLSQSRSGTNQIAFLAESTFDINQRLEQMEVQRRRLSQAVDSYCQCVEF